MSLRKRYPCANDPADQHRQMSAGFVWGKIIVVLGALVLLSGCLSSSPVVSMPNVIFQSVDIAPDGSYLLVGGYLLEHTTPNPSDQQPYSQFPHRLWRYDLHGGVIRLLQFPLCDVSRGRLSASGYMAFYATQRNTYIFIPEEIWFTPEPEVQPPVRLSNIPPGTECWEWHPYQDVLLLGVNNGDGTFTVWLYDPLEDLVLPDAMFEGHGEIESLDLSPSGGRLAAEVNRDICIYDLVSGVNECLGTEAYERRPVWSPNGSKMIFRRCDGNRCSWVVREADGRCEYEIGFGGGTAVWEDEETVWIASEGLYRLDLHTELGGNIADGGDLICP